MFRPEVLGPVALGVVVFMGWAAPAAADYGNGVRFWGRGDFAGAAREFLPAAQRGDAESQYMMGRLYSLGDGVPQDFVQAWVWFDRAARHGHALAAQARDAMAQVLTPGQQALAQASERPPAQPSLVPPRPGPLAATPQEPVQGRAVVLVPRQGVVASARPPRRSPARLVAPGATVEGHLLAAGDLTERVREVQLSLSHAGYYSGPLNGALAPATRQAIRDYQRDTGLPQTGLLSSRMVEQLAQSDQLLADRIRADQQQAAR
ncbi:MAG: peptidoglycan-binding protein [Magnetospirillum sp.]|nr:peptidoglycan-binding protein [Magnetospirillum sp.]